MSQMVVKTKDPVAGSAVNHPDHYGGENNPYEVIKIIDAYNLNFDLGNVIKYVLRAGHKDSKLQDLEKAKWYLQHEIDKIKDLEFCLD